MINNVRCEMYDVKHVAIAVANRRPEETFPKKPEVTSTTLPAYFLIPRHEDSSQ